MTKSKNGFTLIEVALFLVITGALFVAVTVGVQNSITQQRINDSVQNFVEFLRTVYAGVLNVENLPGRGNSEQAIYGKLITFGETFEGADSNKNHIYVYTVVGKADTEETGSALELLDKLQINIVEKTDSGIRPYGIVESYTPRWGSVINPACNGDNCSYAPYKGAVLIVRHPSSGTVYTYSKTDGTIEANSYIESVGSKIEGVSISNLFQNGDTNYLTDDSFNIQDIDFCVNPFGDEGATNRRDVRIVKGARNASGIEIIPDGEDDRCQPQ